MLETNLKFIAILQHVPYTVKEVKKYPVHVPEPYEVIKKVPYEVSNLIYSSFH